jgi:membrane-associated phospholipid phosphatase
MKAWLLGASWAVFMSCFVYSGSGIAGAPLQTTLGAASEIQSSTRLSQWLLDHQASAYPLGLQWYVPQERPIQEQLKQQILGWIQDPQDKHHPLVGSEGLNRLSQWVQGLKVTGRVAVGAPDARWLQAHPEQDPILEPGQSVWLPPRSTSVSVAMSNGTFCHLPHTPGTDARGYVRSCWLAKTEQFPSNQSVYVDEAWLIQPDGLFQRVGVAKWNEHPQDEPAPGAWIWAPDRRQRISSVFSDALARMVATQGPSLHDPTVFFSNVPSPSQIIKPPPPHHLDVTASNWGTVGLIQSPTARMLPEGSVHISYSNSWPYINKNFMLQPTDWMEFGFRYTHITSSPLTDKESYLDKSLDIKLRLSKESRFSPELAFGLKDIGGTGLFSGEYVVGSKRYGDLDFSLGLGWGYFGVRGDINNPLGVLSNSYYKRTVEDIGLGGNLSGSSMFRGPTALFGGVQWRTPWAHSLLKLELDGNNYQKEPLSFSYAQKTPLNLAWVQRLTPFIDMQVGFERGNHLSFGMTFHGVLSDIKVPKIGDPELPRFNPNPPVGFDHPIQSIAWQQTAKDVALLTDWQVERINLEGNSLVLAATRTLAPYTQDRINKAIAVLHRDAPATVKRFVLILGEYGLAVSGQEIDRDAWVAERFQAQAPSIKKPSTSVFSVTQKDSLVYNPEKEPISDSKIATLWKNTSSPLKFGIDPTYNQIVGGVDGFVFFKIGLQANAEYRLTPNTWVNGALNMRLLDNFESFRFTYPSALPTVRTLQREYATTSTLTIPNFQLTHVGQLSDQQFFSLYGGILEPMFSGVGGEWLWRPHRSRVALGLDVNHVKQRAFEQDFNFRDYSANTGHLTLYWDTGIQNVLTNVSFGKYLAGDQGVTVGLSRIFANGVSMGVYATKTSASAEQYGEGSFDKGLYVNIPFDVFMPFSSSSSAYLNWNPITRDGGAKLNRNYQLIDLTSGRGRFANLISSPRSKTLQPGDDVFRLPAGLADELSLSDLAKDLGTSARGAGRSLFDSSTTSDWLGAAGLVWLASRMDSSADDWAQNNQSDASLKTAKALDSMPLYLGAGAGALALGLVDEDLARTGFTAVKAAGFTLLGNVALKSAVGRARPNDEVGPGSFNSFSASAPQSSMASNHVATTMALVTPFAQKYEQPWLYGLGALSALGRVYQREHWLSDTVAGGVLGYAVGSVMLDQQRQGPQLSLVGNQLAATWRY